MPGIILITILGWVAEGQGTERELTTVPCANATETLCTSCNAGNYLSNQTCNECPSGCASCESETNCTSCLPEYYNSNSSCYACGNSCLVCSSPTNCSSCSSGYYLSSNSCSECQQTCSSCSSFTNCSTCKTGFYLSNTTCISCPTGCTSCSSATSCSSCAPAYNYTNSQCILCTNLCQLCNQTACITCAPNTYTQNGQCFACSPTTLQAIIIGPTDYSTTCNNNLQYSASLSTYDSSKPINFFWQVQQLNSNGNILWQGSFTGLTINPPVTNQNSTYSVTLSISICSQTSIAVFTTNVRTSAGVVLSPGFETVQVLAGKQVVVRPTINNFCGLSGSPNWMWTGVVNQNSQFLVLSNLAVGVYNESLIVNVAGSVTFYNFTVQVLENQMVAVVSRSSGVASNLEDFRISAAGSYHPDYTNLTFVWSCFNFSSQNTCLNSSGALMNSVANVNFELQQSTLVSGGKMNFTVVVSGGTQKQSVSVIVTFGDYNENVTVVQSSQRVNSLAVNYVLPLGETSESVVWSSTSSVSLPYPYTLYLWIPKNTLTQSPSYSFTLLLNQVEYASLTLYTNQPPSCQSNYILSQSSISFLQTVSPSQPVCSDTDLPMTYTLNYSTPLYFQLSLTILPPISPSSTFILAICDSLLCCTEQSASVSVSGQTISTSELTQQYSNTNPDLIPLTISALALSTQLTSSLFQSMLNDLATYQATYSNSQIAILSALAALTSSVQDPSTISNSYSAIASLLQGTNSTCSNPDLQSFYTIKVNSNLALLRSASNLQSADSNFINSIMGFTSNYFPGQSINVSDPDFTFYKSTQLGSGFAGLVYKSDGRNFTIPATLPFSPTDLINLYFTVYKNKANYSDYAEISFTKSGELSNNSITFQQETLLNVTKLASPILISLKYRSNVNNQWACAYLQGSVWYSSGCKFLQNDSSSISFSTNHTSLFSVFDTSEVKLPPVQYIDNTASCGINLNAIWILVVIVFLFIIFFPVLWWSDNYGWRDLLSNNTYDNVKKSDSEPSIGSPSFSDELPSNNNLSSDYAIQYKPKPQKIRKHCCKVLIEGHLLFGLPVFRTEFSRVLRLITLCTVLIFELLIEGLLMMGFETTTQGSSGTGQTYFADYRNNYFGYTIFALVISIPVEVSLVILFSLKGKMRNFGLASGYVLVIVCLIASIAGIVIMSLKFCPNWSGYWGISFLFGTIVEIVVTQTVLMLFRSLLLRCLS